MGNLNYQAIVGGMPAGIERDVMASLAGHVGAGARVERRALVLALKRLPPYADKRLVRLDRMVRLAIAALQTRGYPILSDSGRGGYWLAGSREEVEGTCREIESRAEALREKARALRTAGKMAWVEPEPEARQFKLEI